MKAVLISIKPKWCELIANGKKTIEVRKTKPKIDVPFKCYIYCTNEKTIGDIILCKSKENSKLFGYNVVKGINKGFAKKEDINLKGKVIGEFICMGIMQPIDNFKLLSKLSCVSMEELYEYSDGKQLYGWRIHNLVIYDKPKELVEFKPIKCEKNFDGECVYKGRCKHQVKCSTWGYRTFKCEKKITIAPRSWGFVEELGV